MTGLYASEGLLARPGLAEPAGSWEDIASRAIERFESVVISRLFSTVIPSRRRSRGRFPQIFCAILVATCGCRSFLSPAHPGADSETARSDPAGSGEQARCQTSRQVGTMMLNFVDSFYDRNPPHVSNRTARLLQLRAETLLRVLPPPAAPTETDRRCRCLGVPGSSTLNGEEVLARDDLVRLIDVLTGISDEMVKQGVVQTATARDALSYLLCDLEPFEQSRPDFPKVFVSDDRPATGRPFAAASAAVLRSSPPAGS